MDDIFASISGIVFDVIRGICYFLDEIVYRLIIYLYNWFLMLCNGRIMSTDGVEAITSKLGLILGVFMLFYVAVSFIQMILEPDKLSDKEMGAGAIVKKVIFVVVMLGISSSVFDLLYDVQKVLLGNNASGTNVIQNLLLSESVDTGRFGEVLSSVLFTAFYDVDADLQAMALENGSSEYQKFETCSYYNLMLKQQILDSQDFTLGKNCLNETTIIAANGDNERYVMNFMSIESVIVGVFIIYILFMYCIKVGVRIIQLAFLEIISPMAIISYLSPKKETMFDKWKNIYISTYIDVFIRVAIINLIVYMIALILDEWHSVAGTFIDSVGITDSQSNPLTKVFIPVIMILALLTFAQRAPELLKEILPSGGPGSIGFGVGAKDNAFGMGFLSKGAGVLTGAVGGLAGGLVAGSIGGAAFGLLRGGVGGLKNKKLGDALKSATGGFNAQKSASLRTAQRIAEGGSRFVLPGTQRRVNDYDSQIAKIDSQVGFMDTAEKEAESKALKNASNYVSYNGNSLSLLAQLKEDQTLTSAQRESYEQEYKDTLEAAKKFNLAYGRDVKNGEVRFDNGGSVTAIDVAGTTYSSPNDINSHVNDLGDANVTINANMDALGVGPAGAGRYAAADSEVKKLKTQRTIVVTSEEYRRAKTDAKYSGGGKH